MISNVLPHTLNRKTMKLIISKPEPLTQTSKHFFPASQHTPSNNQYKGEEWWKKKNLQGTHSGQAYDILPLSGRPCNASDLQVQSPFHFLVPSRIFTVQLLGQATVDVEKEREYIEEHFVKARPFAKLLLDGQTPCSEGDTKTWWAVQDL